MQWDLQPMGQGVEEFMLVTFPSVLNLSKAGEGVWNSCNGRTDGTGDVIEMLTGIEGTGGRAV